MGWQWTQMTEQRARRHARSLPLFGYGGAMLALVLAQLLVPESARMVLLLIPPAAALLVWLLASGPRPPDAAPEGYGFVAVLTALVCLLFPVVPLIAGPYAVLAFGLLILALRGRDLLLLLATGIVTAEILLTWPARLSWLSDPSWPYLLAPALTALALLALALHSARAERRIAEESDPEAIRAECGSERDSSAGTTPA